MMIRTRRAAWLAFALVFVSSGASAQAGSGGAGYTESRTDSGSAVTFTDDLATGGALGPLGDIVKSPPRAARMMLLRPRYNFVSEMLKSVENL